VNEKRGERPLKEVNIFTITRIVILMTLHTTNADRRGNGRRDIERPSDTPN